MGGVKPFFFFVGVGKTAMGNGVYIGLPIVL